MRDDLYIIECRRLDGVLDFNGKQPESFFGLGAIRGMSSNSIAAHILRVRPTAILEGDKISLWPRFIDERWTARRKTW